MEISVNLDQLCKYAKTIVFSAVIVQSKFQNNRPNRHCNEATERQHYCQITMNTNMPDDDTKDCIITFKK